jgi:hypothetical protein
MFTTILILSFQRKERKMSDSADNNNVNAKYPPTDKYSFNWKYRHEHYCYYENYYSLEYDPASNSYVKVRNRRRVMGIRMVER